MRTRLIALLLVLLAAPAARADIGLVAHWDFNEGKGNVLRDKSGNNNHGKIHGAEWVKCGKGHALRFDRSGGYVDFGDNRRLKISADVTVAAWVKLTASPYPDGTTNWHIVHCEEYRKSGFALRVDGATCKLYYRSNQPGTFQHGLSNAKLHNAVFHHVVVAKRGNTAVFFVDGAPDIRLAVKDPAPGPVPFTIGNKSQSFHGLIDDVRIYDRALSVADILGLYKERAASLGKDTSWFGKINVTPFFYFDDKKLILEVDLRGVLPLKEGQQVVVELGPRGWKPLRVIEVTDVPESGKGDFQFALDKLPDGDYEVRVALKDGDRILAQERVPFHYPPLPVAVAFPTEKIVPPLPPVAAPVRYSFELCAGGGFRIGLNGESYPVESGYSFPRVGENRLLAVDARDRKGERGWNVEVRTVDASTYRVVAGGKHYRINRLIELQPSRVLIKDTITNLTGADLGIMLTNHINVQGKQGVRAVAPAGSNPPGFVCAKDHGLGILPLDDVYQVQQRTYASDRKCGVRSDVFGLAPRASYTLEWAVYPVGTADYYDVVNAARKDEGLDNRTVGGCLAITHSGKWLRESPPKELVELGGVKCASSGCVTHIADDPGISIEGIEFIQYPKECAALKNTFIETKRRFPGIKVMFHVAHSLYATNKPEELFADSRIIARSGKHEMYGNFSGYFTEERRAQGYAWYPYYPTMNNSFGKAMLKSVDVMMDEIGTDGVFGDGLINSYGPASGSYPTVFGFTYGEWDGHSVEIDPGTKTVRRKMGAMALLSRDAVIAYIRKINSKGGLAVINHMNVVPRTFARENAIYCAETNDGDHRCAGLHLAPTVIGLAHPDKFRSVQSIYDDIRGKLSWGALYFYYWWGGAGHLTHKMITTEMYPITVTEIRSGTIKGKQRIITLHSGVYGWRGDKCLHCAVLCDARGRLVPNDFLTTVDRSGVRTEMAFRENEMAVLKKIPITLDASAPVNLSVRQYDANGIRIVLNGRGDTQLVIKTGDFAVTPGAAYNVKSDRLRKITAAKDGLLRVSLRMDGAMSLQIEKE